MPQFQIRRHPHGHTVQLFKLSPGEGRFISPKEYNSVQEAMDAIEHHIGFFGKQERFWLEVLPD